jgi:hypothetical protein
MVRCVFSIIFPMRFTGLPASGISSLFFACISNIVRSRDCASFTPWWVMVVWCKRRNHAKCRHFHCIWLTPHIELATFDFSLAISIDKAKATFAPTPADNSLFVSCPTLRYTRPFDEWCRPIQWFVSASSMELPIEKNTHIRRRLSCHMNWGQYRSAICTDICAEISHQSSL